MVNSCTETPGHQGVILRKGDLELHGEIVDELRATELVVKIEEKLLLVWFDLVKSTVICQYMRHTRSDCRRNGLRRQSS